MIFYIFWGILTFHEPVNYNRDPPITKSLSCGALVLENTGNAAADVHTSTVKAATIVIWKREATEMKRKRARSSLLLPQLAANN